MSNQLARFVCILSLFTLTVFADDDRESKSSPKQPIYIHPLTNMPDASPDVKTSYIFPKHADQKFPIGETVTVLCHLSNEGQLPYNVTAIMGSMNSPFDFNFHIQNYSYKPFGIVVKPGEEVTFEYQFQLHQNLEPVEYALAHTVFYEDNSESFSSTFFNQTVELYFPNSEYDLETIFQLGFSLVSTLFIICLVYYTCGPEKNYFSSTLAFLHNNKRRRGGRSKAAVNDDDDWVTETEQSPSRQARSSTSSSVTKTTNKKKKSQTD